MKKIKLVVALLALCSLSESYAQKKHSQKIPKFDGYKLVWHDEFNKDGRPDSSKWGYEIGFIRNKEPQWYQPQNASCKDGFLTIEVKKETVPNPNYNDTSSNWVYNRKEAHYTSACLISLHKFDFTFGKVQMRGKIDTRQGMWPAFWMLGTSRGATPWPACGEVDIMEFYRKKLLGNIFWSGGMKDIKIPLDSLGDASWSDRFHVWDFEWDKDSMIISVDGRLVNSFDIAAIKNKSNGLNPFHQPMYMLLNVALGQGGEKIPDENLPAKFVVDYVRVYQKK